MWRLLENVPYTNNAYTKMHIEQVCNNGALQKLLVFGNYLLKVAIETLN